MLIEKIDHATLSRLAESSAVRGARATGQVGGWSLLVKFDANEYRLTAHGTDAPHIFLHLDNLANYLKGLGIARFDVDAVHFSADENAIPGHDARASVSSGAPNESAYSTWLKAEIQEAIDDPTPGVPHEEALRQVRAAIKNS